MATTTLFIPLFTTPTDVLIAITSPSAGTDVDPYVGVTISGTCSVSASTIEVFLGSTSLGFATITGGTSWSLTNAIMNFGLAGAGQNLTAVANGSVTSAAVSIDVLSVRESFMLLSPHRVWFPPETVTTDYRVDAANLEGGTRIDRWYSPTNASHLLAQDTDADQPELLSVSSEPSLVFNGGDGTNGDRMNFDSPFVSGLANFDFFIAYRRTATTSSEDMIDADAGEFRIRLDAVGHFRVFMGSTSNNGRTTDIGADPGVNYLAFVRWDGAGSANADRLKIEIDGVQRTLTFTGTVAQSAGHTTMCAGRTTANATPFTGSMFMIGAFNRTLDSDDKAKFYALIPELLSWY